MTQTVERQAPSLREEIEDGIVVVAYVAAEIWWTVYDSEICRGLFCAVLLIGAAAGVFTDTGSLVTGDLIAALLCTVNAFADLFGLPRIDVGGMV
ncbi:hypothetical protein [Acetobacter malorum]|uniref:Uncharacterized protein n=1 Tax=Acetobacter malorum TaxID=178901 RepID=A0A1Y3G712_9PROT|nr:hypothetical protein [Acetobacter malorum]OUJ06622.1 hypothetical protein HK23_14165 [Acetobacter malorum]